MQKEVAEAKPAQRSGPLTDLAMTLPIFVGYHAGVIFLPVRNAADWVTRELQELANFNLWAYLGLTVLIGAAYITPLVLAGRGKHLVPSRFAWLGTEGVIYAIAMRLLAGYAAARLLSVLSDPSADWIGLMRLAPALSSSVEAAGQSGALSARLSGAVMSLGAGFYEELVFRVGFYGLGAILLLFLLNLSSVMTRLVVRLGWAIVAACLFSAWHYIGELGEPFDLSTFSFRAVCGLIFTGIYHFRGFAPAVWTHALYDLWVLVL